MNTVCLIPKTGKASRLIQQANAPDHWIVLEVRESVGFSEREGPWLHVIPDNNNQDKSRWVHQHNDTDFTVEGRS